MNAKLKFAFEKETKGAVRYQEVGDDGAPAFAPQVGTLYVRKSAMPGGKIPKTLIVTSQANNCAACRRVVLCEDAGLRTNSSQPMRRRAARRASPRACGSSARRCTR